MENEMQVYENLIYDSLFEEAFILLEKNISQIDDTIDKSKYIRDFFETIFTEEFLNDNNILPIAIATVDSLNNKEFLKSSISKFPNFVSMDRIMVMFAFLIKANEFERSKFLLPYINSNITLFPKRIEEIINNNNINGLRFVCEKMENIHFNEDQLLRMASKMDIKAIKMLVEEFHFDINQQSKDNGFNFIHTLINGKNLKTFKFIVENYSENINWAATTIKKTGKAGNTLFDMIKINNYELDFFGILLDNMNLKTNFIDRIASYLLANNEIVNTCCDSDIYTKLFAHPNFDPEIINLGQGYFLYGILSKLGEVATSLGEDEAKSYLKILDAYIKTYPDDDVPEATNFNIVGAAVHVASKSESKVVTSGASLILRRYSKYINKPNPFGSLPILQVAPDSPIYRVLINNGAIPPEPEPGFWGSIFKKKKNNTSIESSTVNVNNTLNNMNAINNQRDVSNLMELQNQMREDFSLMRGYISNPLCDPTIKMKCELMFLKSTKLVGMMQKHNVTNAFDDMHFLGENFSNYLKKSLHSYINLCQATVDLSSNEQKEIKLQLAKKQCMEQVDLLTEQVSLISSNVFNEVEGAASRDLNISGRFLKNRFPNTEYEIHTVSNNPEDSKKIETLNK